MLERSFIANSMWGISSNVLKGLIGLAFIPFLVLKLGLSNYGTYTIILLFTFYQGIPSQLDLGYPSFLVNFIARNKENSNQVTARLNNFSAYLFILNALILLLVFLLSLLENNVFIKTNQISLSIILFSNFFSILFIVYSPLWIAHNRNAGLKKIEAQAFIIFVLFTSIFLTYKNNIVFVCFAYLISQFFLGVRLKLKSNIFFPHKLFFYRFDFLLLKKDWNLWRKFFFSKINGITLRYTDILIVSSFLEPKFVGIYDLSLKIPYFIKTTFGKVSELLGPFFSTKNKHIDLFYIQRIVQTLTEAQIFLGLFFVINIYLLPNELLMMIPSKDSKVFLNCLFLGSLINIVLPPASVLLPTLMARSSTNTNRRIINLMFFNSIFNIALSILLTIYFGVYGTIFSTVIQFFGLSLIATFFSSLHFNFSVFTLIRKAFFLFLFLFFPVYFIENNSSIYLILIKIIIINCLVAILVLWYNKKEFKELLILLTNKSSKI
jgi:O-antigen/teichoic acid export membrane protein